MRARTTWLLFLGAAGVVFAVMMGVSWALLQLEASRAAVLREAVREELVRLALWRMDSVMTPLLSREIAEAGADLRGALPQGVRARFVIHPGGHADAVGSVDDATRESMLVMIAAQSPAATLRTVEVLNREVAGSYRSGKQGEDPGPLVSQSMRNAVEYGKRVASVQESLVSSSLSNPSAAQAEGGVADVPDAILEMMQPLWWGDELVMVRRVQTAAGERIDGTWLDWGTVHGILRAEIADLLPEAELVAEAPTTVGDHARRLATLPVGLRPGEVALPSPPTGPLRLAIGAAWVFVAIALGAVAMLLRGSLLLSERRASFVSAVTHELRTPLTTFRMYTEMLEGGMVEEHKRGRYLATLRREAERLGQLVENVLSYARIEADDDRGRDGPAPERVAIAELVTRGAPRLVERCSAAGLQLRVAVAAEVEGCAVRGDPVAIEQILANLVDNAAKYGASEAAPDVEVALSRVGRTVEIAVRDFGPGVPDEERARVFEPFAKGSAHAAGTQPGVGLGLALARRMARRMGATLELRAADPGARFVLVLPVVGG